ncbi:hypothetical protein M5K25_018640 [Dendrobium thyrsiflorum]|uniref:Uncharacterized protein n=1 Tax=Dendrobium thyrsiflorum TaxID=117978 RepID=A0ABD0UQN0_DENTH
MLNFPFLVGCLTGSLRGILHHLFIPPVFISCLGVVEFSVLFALLFRFGQASIGSSHSPFRFGQVNVGLFLFCPAVFEFGQADIRSWEALCAQFSNLVRCALSCSLFAVFEFGQADIELFSFTIFEFGQVNVKLPSSFTPYSPFRFGQVSIESSTFTVSIWSGECWISFSTFYSAISICITLAAISLSSSPIRGPQTKSPPHVSISLAFARLQHRGAEDLSSRSLPLTLVYPCSSDSDQKEEPKPLLPSPVRVSQERKASPPPPLLEPTSANERRLKLPLLLLSRRDAKTDLSKTFSGSRLSGWTESRKPSEGLRFLCSHEAEASLSLPSSRLFAHPRGRSLPVRKRDDLPPPSSRLFARIKEQDPVCSLA